MRLQSNECCNARNRQGAESAEDAKPGTAQARDESTAQPRSDGPAGDVDWPHLASPGAPGQAAGILDRIILDLDFFGESYGREEGGA